MGNYELIRDQLFEIANDGFADEEIGTVDAHGWFAIVTDEGDNRWIIADDTQGFRDYEEYTFGAWQDIQDMYAGYYDDEDEES